MIIHAYLHALPGMLATAWPQLRDWIWLGAAIWMAAFVCLVSAGYGLLGWSFFATRWRQLATIGAWLSIVLHVGAFQWRTWPGMVADLLIVYIAYCSEPLEVLPKSRGAVGRIGLALVQGVASLMLLHGAAAIILRPWHQNWGATTGEIARTMPGDNLTMGRTHLINHVVSVDAPPEKIWPWLVQLGQDKAGFYSYDWLERSIGDRIRNVPRIVPEFQHLKEGDLVRATQPDYLGGFFGNNLGWRVTKIVPYRLMVLENWGPFWIEPDGPGRSRLGVRTEIGDVPFWTAPIEMFMFEPMHFTMEQRMLRTIKELAEASR